MNPQRRLRLFATVSHRLFRDGLLFQILHNEDIELVGESETGVETLQRLAAVRPGVLLIEENLKDNDEYRILEKKQHMLDDLLVSQARMDEMMEEVFGKDAAEEFRREHL
mgnify:CR=1 FL=1